MSRSRGKTKRFATSPNPRAQSRSSNPPISILAQPAVAWVDANVTKHHSEAFSKAYLESLFSDDAQEIIAKEGYRPKNKAIAAHHADRLPLLNSFPSEQETDYSATLSAIRAAISPG